ncbi:GNAT family N-acetyltransferase [Glacieibacterium megasporae]|uniref:GNAT family N-acetyltransferase n=1 Tax=Glacieibacterium megasporae TaxID=2835787 RepID=UPI001C1E1F2A|nr:GNAT family N-acetyltransferase [Polymorphobacter megasporae]UAJ09978.1 GNAT family N-acetyltransferase [Polymorphobacter megasporae]
MVEVPVIETARLRLRGHRASDLDAAAAKWADPVVTRFTGGRPFTREESWARLLRYTGHWDWFGYGFWAVEDRDDGNYLGELGFANFERAIAPPIEVPEMGWSFIAAAHGRGLASEGIRAALAWGDAHGFAKTACIIDRENVASIRVARRCGFVEAGAVRYKGSITMKYERAAG